MEGAANRKRALLSLFDRMDASMQHKTNIPWEDNMDDSRCGISCPHRGMPQFVYVRGETIFLP